MVYSVPPSFEEDVLPSFHNVAFASSASFDIAGLGWQLVGSEPVVFVVDSVASASLDIPASESRNVRGKLNRRPTSRPQKAYWFTPVWRYLAEIETWLLLSSRH